MTEETEGKRESRDARRTSDNVRSEVPLADPVRQANWKARAILAAVVVVLVIVGYVVGSTLVPRWWAQRVADRVDGSMTAGTLYGLLLGFLFTFFPLVVARQALRHVSRGLRITFVLAALALAAPNLMTLAIVVGNGNGAHAGERILDVDGPGFRAGTAWGAAIAVLVAVGLFVWAWRARRDRQRLKSLKAQQRESQRAASADPE